MQRSVVKDYADTSLFREFQENLQEVGFVEVVCEHVHSQTFVLQHLIGNLKNFLARSKTQPVVLIGEGVVVSFIVSSGNLRSIEQQLLLFGFELGFQPEVMDKCLRLCKPTRESNLNWALSKGRHFHADRN